MTLFYKDLYNEITGQAWSMFDGEIDSADEMETSVTTSIQKALTDLWFCYEFDFRKKTYKIKTKENSYTFELPNGAICKKNGKFDVKYGKKHLDLIIDTDDLEERTGEPEAFYIENNKLCIYPIPDDRYTIDVGYLSMLPACNEDDEEIDNLYAEKDYVNIPEKYENLFKCTLLPLAMSIYLIASDSDENYSLYREQYERALIRLKKATQTVKLERVVGW